MNFSFYVIVNIICKTIGLYTMLIFMRMPGIDILFGNNDPSSIPWALLLYTAILVIAIVAKVYVNRKINLNQPKTLKLQEVKDSVLYRLNRRKNIYKELIIDYKIAKKFKTYLATPVIIEKLYIPNKKGIKDKVRIIIKAKLSNY
jgi:hypothetical protein